ncbi:MAG: PaaI family thioesterase [Haloarculaceae archaeon]
MTNTDSDADRSPVPADREFFPEGTFNEWLGLSVEEFEEGEVVVSVDFEEFKRNPAGVMHGGVTATLIDVAGGVAIRSVLGDPEMQMSTTDLDVSYLRPVTDTAYASASVVRMGESNAVIQVEVESTAPDGERKTVAVGTVTYMRH